MLTATIWHGQDGYTLSISEAPLWALVAEETAEGLCVCLGHPLCRGVWPIGFRLGQRLLSPAARRSRQRWTTPLTHQQAEELFCD